MTGWLLYTPEGAARNRTFIEFWMDAAAKRGVGMELRLTDEPFPAEKPDFAVVRAMDSALSLRLEQMDIPVFNPASVSEICNDKWKTYCLASSLGVPFPKTVYVPDPAALPSVPYPYVLKACGGHGGTQVYMVDNERDARFASEALKGVSSVLQEPVSDLGRDVRVYILGDRILAAMLRVSDTDFRSNFCLGGRAVPYSLSDDEIEMVRAFQSALPFGLAGIDFLFHEGKAVFNEIEDVVGCRMLYTHTEIRPVELYFDWILQHIHEKM